MTVLVGSAAVFTLSTSTFNREMAVTEATLIDAPVRSDARAWGGLRLSEVRFRSIRAADLGILHSFVHHLSPETGYKRLLSPRTPSDDELRRWSAIDPATECALVAVVGPEDQEELIGVARFVVESPGEADFAIVLADAWQGLGLGRELMSRLVDAARLWGLRKVRGDVLATNTGMIALARRSGFAARRSGIVSTLSLDLQRQS
ncbi:GNAT family N-acetyltransferase [Variovorax guangxiensis]|uniref:GNAT family N-acetyltransferase n=1 Tax=Variovorax guangxiensis TaxID=1775474 RepID=UPI00286B8105|nr:GNAT family N-acetyltransferase [Variovorax guangxiensis]